MEFTREFLTSIKETLSIPLFHLGESWFTLWTLLYTVTLLTVLIYASRKVTVLFTEGFLARRHVDVGTRQAIGTLFRYFLMVVGVFIILQTAGINLTSLTVLAGALGVGIGFGLQNLVNNVVSGLVILVERPIKIGDRVEVGDVFGNVTKIAMRATTVLTNDNVSIIVPNSHFISERVVNWSYNDRKVRLRIQVGVSYDADPEEVRKALLEVAEANSTVLKIPKPSVLLDSFGDNSLNFVLRVWTEEYVARPGLLRSELNFAIHRIFRERGIEVPFPQLDLHVRGGRLNVNAKTASEDGGVDRESLHDG